MVDIHNVSKHIASQLTALDGKETHARLAQSSPWRYFPILT